MNLKNTALTALLCSASLYAGYTAYNYHMNELKKARIEASTNGYRMGYKEGYTIGKNECQTSCSYQSIMDKLDVQQASASHTAENYVFTEARIRKIMEKSNPSLSKNKKNQYIKYIVKWSDEYGLSPIFVAAMIHRETNFNEKAVSSAKAKGALQVVAKWHPEKLKELGIKENDLHSINYGIHVGCWVIKDYLELENWDYKKALTRYVGAVDNKSTAEGYIKDIFDMMMYAYS